MKKSMLVMKGNYTQRQFDTLGKLWDNLQKDEGLPAIQLSDNGNIGVLTFHDDGSVTGVSAFGDSDTGIVANKMDLISAVLTELSTEEQTELYNKLHNKGCRLVRR